jgi:hypothetical protein
MPAPDPQEESRRFVILRRLRDLPDALLAKSILDSADIECFLGDEITIRMNWFKRELVPRTPQVGVAGLVGSYRAPFAQHKTVVTTVAFFTAKGTK